MRARKGGPLVLPGFGHRSKLATGSPRAGGGKALTDRMVPLTANLSTEPGICRG